MVLAACTIVLMDAGMLSDLLDMQQNTSKCRWMLLAAPVAAMADDDDALRAQSSASTRSSNESGVMRQRLGLGCGMHGCGSDRVVMVDMHAIYLANLGSTCYAEVVSPADKATLLALASPHRQLRLPHNLQVHLALFALMNYVSRKLWVHSYTV